MISEWVDLCLEEATLLNEEGEFAVRVSGHRSYSSFCRRIHAVALIRLDRTTAGFWNFFIPSHFRLPLVHVGCMKLSEDSSGSRSLFTTRFLHLHPRLKSSFLSSHSCAVLGP